MKLNVSGLDIHYEEKNSTKNKTILFLHGNSHDRRSFSLQLESPLFKDYRLLSVDLPGHGLSSEDKKYSAITLAKSVHQFLTLLELENVLLVGHSLGGHVIMHLLELYYPKGIFVYGAPPLKKPLDMSGFKELPEAQALFKEDVSDQEKKALISCLYQNPECDPYLDESFHQTDPRFRSQIIESLTNGEHLDEVELLNHYNAPKAILTAKKDQLINADYIKENIQTQQLWNQQITQLSGSHNLHRDVPDEFNKTLLSFLNQVSFS